MPKNLALEFLYGQSRVVYVIVRKGVKFGINFMSCSENGYRVTTAAG